MKILLVPVALVCSVVAIEASACTYLPMSDEDQARRQAQMEQDFLENARSAEAIVEVEALTSSGQGEGHSIFKIRRVLAGDARVGSKRKLRTETWCGAPGVKRGDLGVTYISKDTPDKFKDFIPDVWLDLLRNEGIISE